MKRIYCLNYKLDSTHMPLRDCKPPPGGRLEFCRKSHFSCPHLLLGLPNLLVNVYSQGRKCSFLPGCACLYLYWLTHITCFENKWWWWWWTTVELLHVEDLQYTVKMRGQGQRSRPFWPRTLTLTSENLTVKSGTDAEEHLRQQWQREGLWRPDKRSSCRPSKLARGPMQLTGKFGELPSVRIGRSLDRIWIWCIL